MEFNKSLKIAWILKYISDECKSKWKCFFYFYLSKFGGKLVFLGNLSKKDAILKLNVKDISDECKSKWKCFFYFYLSKFGGKLVFRGNLSKKDAILKLNVKDNFLQELTEIWADFNYRDSFDSQRDFSGSLIWNNSLVRIAGEAVFYKHWAKARSEKYQRPNE